MAITLETIRRITIQGSAPGVDDATAAIVRLAVAQGRVSVTTDTQAKKVLSAAEAYKRQTLAVVDGAKAQDQLARAIKTADAALQQGLITTSQHAERIRVLNQKYGEASVASRGFGAAIGDLRLVLASFGLVLGVAQVVGWAQGLVASTSQLVDQANQVGVTVSALQAYRHALEDNGAAASVADTLVSKLSRTLGEAEIGSKDARAAFDALGINWRDLERSSRPIESAVQAVASAIAAISDPAQRAAQEVIFFGRSGTQVGAALGDLSMNIDSLTGKFRDQGRIMKDEVARQNKLAVDQMNASFQSLEVRSAPHIAAVTEKLAELIRMIDVLSNMSLDQWWDRFWMTEASVQAEIAAAGRLTVGDRTPSRTPFGASGAVALLGGATVINPGRPPETLQMLSASPSLGGRDGSGKGIKAPKKPGASPELHARGMEDLGFKDYLRGLREEVMLAGMTAFQRERMRAVLDAEHKAHGRLNDDIKKQINDTIRLRQLAEIGDALSGLDRGFGGSFAQSAAVRSALADATARMNILKDAHDAMLISEQEYQGRLTALNEQANRERADAEMALMKDRLGMASDFFGNLASLSQSSNKTLAAIGKAAAITQATIDGILAVQKALASYPPPLNYVMAAGVGVAGAVNVSKIAGFERGGYTGDGGRSQVAGVVHGQEWVSHAAATANNRRTLEAMNAGASFDRFFAEPANNNSRSGPVINVIHDGSTRVVVERTSPGEIRIIARQEIQEMTPNLVATQLHNRNSPIAKARKATQQRA